jgi:hypothetical protein
VSAGARASPRLLARAALLAGGLAATAAATLGALPPPARACLPPAAVSVEHAAPAPGATYAVHAVFPCESGACAATEPATTFTVGDAAGTRAPAAPAALDAGTTACSSCVEGRCGCAHGSVGGWDFRATGLAPRMPGGDADVVHFDVHAGDARVAARVRDLAVLDGRYHPLAELEVGAHRADGLVPPGALRVVAVDAAGNASPPLDVTVAAGPCPAAGLSGADGGGGCSVATAGGRARGLAPSAPAGLAAVAAMSLARRRRSRQAPRA